MAIGADTDNVIRRGNACSGLNAQSGVDDTGSIVKESLITDCRIADAGAIGEEGLITVGRIEGASGVVKKRTGACGGVKAFGAAVVK